MYNSLSHIQNELSDHSTTVSSVLQHYLQRIEEHKHLNAFIEVFEDEAKARAAEIDQRLKQGRAGKLAGLVMGIKDNISYKGHQVSVSSRILQNYESLYNATVVERLLKEDAIIVGRTNCDEFAMGSSNENSWYGSVANPHDNQRVTGGSSGGSAAAVAADLCLAALGSDTGGSVRQPASFTGMVGLKPTYGRVSRYGLLAYASSFDQIGPITKNVEDAAKMMQVMAGADEYDSTASPREVPDYMKNFNLRSDANFRIGYLKSPLEVESLDPEVRDKLLETVEWLQDDGHQVEPVEFELQEYLVPSYYVLSTAEASANLARYDGIHYGYRSPNATDVGSTYLKSRSEGFGPEVKRRIMTGTFVLSAGYYDAYYTKAQRIRRLIYEKTVALLKQYDFLLLPTTPATAFKIGEKTDDPVKMYLEDVFTVHANLAGVPAVSLPLGKHSNGLPFGLQVYTRHFGEERLFPFADYLMNMA